MISITNYKKHLSNLKHSNLILPTYNRKNSRIQRYIQQNSIRTLMRQLRIFIQTKAGEKPGNVDDFINKKILVLFACHTNSEIKFKTVLSNLKYFKKTPNVDIVVINSTNTPYSELLKNFLQGKCSYFEIENAPTIDHGKWIYALENIDYSSYNNVIFTNDSYIIHGNIDRFLFNSATTNVEFYGYNDSTQCNYHYQSYLFSILQSAIKKFITIFYEKLPYLHSYFDIINHCELQMLNYFSRDCYLKIGNIPFHRGKNIFFDNDYLYYILKNSGLLPFTKIRSIT